MTEKKVQQLRRILQDMGRVLVAFSGGADSTYLLKMAVHILGAGNVLAVTAISPVMTQDEEKQVKTLARRIGARLMIVDGPEMGNARFLKNDSRRCYWCKRDRFRELKKIARRQRITFVIEGSNADDSADYRPGMQAVTELGVRSPLLEAGLTKKEIRRLSRTLGLATWNKPAAACLASRIAYGTSINSDLLGRIASAEKLLHAAGFSSVRLRHHGDIARIEVPAEEIATVVNPAGLKKIITGLKKLGWAYVTLDLEGYTTGSLNRILSL
jgi:pyridinium-3,5-biscarboxylic acid mononucleotide sulfurtransferase